MSNPLTPTDALRTGRSWRSALPDFDDDDPFIDVVRALSLYVIKIIWYLDATELSVATLWKS